MNVKVPIDAQPRTANTVIGSVGAIVGAVGVTALAAAAPVTGAVFTILGAGVAAGALYRKLAEKRDAQEKEKSTLG